MVAVLPGRFGNRELRPVKRRLSVYEKSSLPTHEGRALILPGAPNTEIEELVDAGYNSCHIFGVEQDPVIYQQLMSHYHDNVHIYRGEICDWMAKSRAPGEYSYVHLDFCGHFTREEAAGIQAWRTIVAPTARVRLSIFRGRRSPLQFDWEEQMHEDLLLAWCQLGYDNDTVDPERWVDYHNQIAETMDDTTQIVIAIMLCNFFFGIEDYRKYVDSCREHGPYLPTVNGNHILTNVYRWTYNEAGSPNYMFTVWADLLPIPPDPLRNSTQWILNEMSKVFTYLNYHIPAFSPNLS